MDYRALLFYVKAANRNEIGDLLAFLVKHHKLFGLIKRKRFTSISKRRLQPPLTNLSFP